MTLALPNPSTRFLRAATAERADLVRHRERLSNEREKLLYELRRLDHALADADERLGVLAQLIGDPTLGTTARGTAQEGLLGTTDGAGATSEDSEAAPANGNRTILRGPAIRAVAVKVLISQPEHIEALHYRRWYELLEGAGYSVAGKEPLAVFLTQISRSPVVRKAAQPGVYEVDRQAPLRIRQRLERLGAELRELAVAPEAPIRAASAQQAPIELASVRARRHELDLAISQQEKALEEALRVLRRDDRDDRDDPAVDATGPR